MKKRFLSMLLALLMLLTLLPFNSFAAEIVDSGTCGENGDNVTWTLDSDGLLIISGSGEMGDYLYDDYDYSPFDNREDIHKVVIEKGVTSIGKGAFRGCSNMTSVTIPNSVTSVGVKSFYYCRNLASVTIPNSVTSIGTEAFYKCAYMTSVTIPNSVTSISRSAFEDCRSLTNVTIPNSVTSIGSKTFFGCTSLTSVKISNSVTRIEERTFQDCYDLASVTIPDSVTSIGDSAFQDCYDLTSVTIPDSVTSIGDCAFASCNTLTSVTIPDSVTSIGDSAFQDCQSLETVTIPNSVTSISRSAFEDCRSLNSVTIPDSVTSIGDSAFQDCQSLETVTIPSSVTRIGYSAFNYCKKLRSLIIPDSVTSIGDFAFGSCVNLSSVKIPGSVVDIGLGVFLDCSGLSEINVSRENSSYNSDEGVLFDKSGKTLIACPCRKLGSYSIPTGVTSIGDYAFGGCMISGVIIPNSVTSIGNNAFLNCLYLTSVTIPNSVTCIGESAFEDCNLEKVTIPSSVNSIGDYAFSFCDKLTSVTIPDGVTYLGCGAFHYCSGLTSVTLPGSVTKIGEFAFEWCEGLSNVKILNGVTSIGARAFKNCTSLTNVTIPDSVTSLGDSAFFNCRLTSVTIPDSVTHIGSGAFGYCRMTSVTIPGSISSIEDYSFHSCSGLTSVMIPDSVTTIGDGAFYNCDSLSDIYFSGTEEQWNQITIGYHDNYNLNNVAIHFNSDLGTYIKTITPDELAIRVVNEWGKGESRTAVTYVDQDGNTVKLYTDSYGYTLLSKPSVTDTTLTVKKGKRTWNGSTAGRARYSEIVLPSDPHRLASALYSAKKDFSHSKDLLTKTKTLNLKNDGNYIGDLTKGNFYLRCTALDPSLVSEYELWQNDKKIETSADGTFSPLSVKSFSLGGGCFVRSIGKDGSKTDTKINLEFASNTVNEELALDWEMDEITFTVPDRIPFVGGSTVKSKLPMNFPVSTYFSDNKVRLLINVNAAGGKTDDELFDEVRERIDGLKKFSGMPLKVDEQMKSLIRKSSDAKFFKDGKLQVLGYLEHNYGENTSTGQILLLLSIKAFDGTYNTVVYVVPVTVQFTVELEAGLLGQISYDFNQKKWGGKAEFNITPKLTVFGGVGYDKALSLGAYGKGDLAFSFNLIGEPHGLKTVDLTAELGVKAYVAFMEFSRAFAHQTWHLYTKNAASLYGEGESWNARAADASQYEVSDLSYLRQESEWLGGSMSLQDAEARTTLTPLLTDTYRNAQPTMISDGSSLYAAFVRADAESGSRYVSVTRNLDGVWSAPVQADPDAILDSSPALCAAPDGTVWLAYARTTADSQDSLLTYAQNQEIVVGTIDPETLAFTEVTTYSGDYVHAPMLTVLNGNPVLSWIDAPVTDENSVLTQSSGTICCAALNGGSWGAASEIVTADGSVTDYAVGMENGAYAAAYAVDNTLYQVHEGQTPAVLSDAFTGAVRYGLLPGTDAAAFLWNGENVLNSSDGTMVPVEGITSEFAVSGNHIYYSMDTDGSADLASLQYETERENWSFPIVLTDGNRYLENLSAAEMNGQDYVLGMHTAVAIGEDSVDDPKNLVFSVVQPVSDLCIEEAICEAENPVPGEYAQVSLKVTNHGDHTVEAIKVMRDGQTVTVMHMPDSGLIPGDTMVVGAHILYPDKLTSYQFSVTEVDKDDYTPDDNTYTLSLGYADAAADLEYLQIGTKRALLATIENNGIETASGKIVFYDADGNAVEERSFEDLAAGDQIVTEYTLEPNFSGINGGTVSAEVVLDQEEIYTYNNRATVTILEPQTTIRSFDGESASVYCNTDTDAAAICAFYDAAGKMLHSQRMTLEAGKLNTLTFAPPEGAVSAKLCVLDPVNGWKPLTAAMEHSI